MRAFVTATGTEVGKTFVTCAWVHQLRAEGRSVRALKPIHSGYDPADRSSDAARLMEALGETDVNRVTRVRYAAPLSPDMAAAREGEAVDFASAVASVRAAEAEAPDAILVEGIGGVMVPLDARRTVLDLMAAVGYPAVLVAGAYLGTLSHTLTALAALEARRLEVAAVLLTEAEPGPVPLDETRASLRPHVPARVPILGLPRADSGRSVSPFGALEAAVRAATR